MKYKTSRPYWPSRFFRTPLFKGFIFFTLWFSLWESVPPAASSEMGALEGLEELVKIQETKFKTLNELISTNPKLLTSIQGLHSLTLDPTFVQSILFHSDPKYLALMGDDECVFYALLKNDLLKTKEGKIRNIMVLATNEQEKRESAVIPKEDFFNYAEAGKCPHLKELGTLFSLPNLSKTLEKMSFPTPKSEHDCQKIHNDLTKSQTAPFLCGIAEIFAEGISAQDKLKRTDKGGNLTDQRALRAKVDKAIQFKPKLNDFTLNYLQNFCQNTDDSQNFCAPYLSQSAWSKVINGEIPKESLVYLCQSFLGKKPVSDQDLKACAKSFVTDPTHCHFLGNSLFPALSPGPSCDTISEAIKNSRLQAHYQDCPGRIRNEGITNGFRVFTHLQGQNFDSTPKTCVSETSGVFARLNMDADNGDIWKLRICFDDKILKSEVCYPTIMGEFNGSEFSEDIIISKILQRTKGAPKNLKCHVINKKEYNPARLEHKVGCFVLYDESKCVAMNCPKKIIYNQKEYNHMIYKGNVLFDYFPNTYKTKRYSIDSVFQDFYKFKVRPIRNLTDLKFFMKNAPEALAHGIGCAEDLLPYFFRKSTLNECRPLSFIVDGQFLENSRPFLVVRTGIDSVHLPRIMPWSQVFNAVKAYQELHPLKGWTFYGIKK